MKGARLFFAGSVFAWLLLAVPAADAAVHSLGGSARFQVGRGLPVPITPAPMPVGNVLTAPGGPETVMQTGAKPGPKKLTLPPGVLSAPLDPLTLPAFQANSRIFQIRTALRVVFPETTTIGGGAAGSAVFSAGGRTGAVTTTFCTRGVPTPPFTCPSGSRGRLRYTATRNQFGGPARAQLQGSANLAVRAGAGAPCMYNGGEDPSCRVSMAPRTGVRRLGQGAAFGGTLTDPGTPIASGRLYVTATSNGRILAATPTGEMGAGLANPVTSYGGPWTTGMLTVSRTDNVGGYTVFIVSGSDNRAVNGRGSLSLVSGSVTRNSLVGPRGNVAWLELRIGPPAGAHVPALPLAGLLASAALAVGSGGVALRRR